MISPRIELTRIREVYQYMGDAALLTFAREEGLKLSTDAYLVLKEELQKRNIGSAVLRQLEHEMIVRYGAHQKKFEADLHQDLFISSLEFALSAKYHGSSQYAIYAGLIERGISEDYANYMINKLDEWALQYQKASTLEMQTGAGIFILGIIVLLISLQIDRFELAALFIALIGLGRLLFSWSRKRQYKKIAGRLLLEKTMHD